MLNPRLHAKGNRDLLNYLVQQVTRLTPHLNIQTSHGARQIAFSGNSVRGNPGAHLPPRDQHAGTHIGTAREHGRNLHSNLTHRVDKILGQMRPRGMTTMTTQVNLNRV